MRYVWGINSIVEIIKSKKRKVFKLLYAKTNCKIDDILKSAKLFDIPFKLVEKSRLDKLIGTSNHQGIVAIVEDIKFYSVDDALSFEKDLKKTCWLAVDSITDTGNLGNIIRSAVCFGFSSIIIPARRNASITPGVEKASSGAIERINIVSVSNLNQTIIELKKRGFWIYGSAKTGQDIRDVEFIFPLLLIIGSEEKGIHKKTLSHCDKIISISQKTNFDSLNAATASGIMMYEISKRM